MIHGTSGGYQSHLRKGEKACDACMEASRKYAAAFRARAGESLKARQKRWARARGRALTKLVAAHPEEYEDLRLAELQRLPLTGVGGSHRGSTANSAEES